MTQVILHIGMHKTGSSSIQETLRGYDDGRIRYAWPGRQPNHTLHVAHLFGRRDRVHGADARRGIRDRDELSDDIAEVRAELRAALRAGGRLILSAEAFSTMPGPGIGRLGAMLARHEAQVRVIGYARDPVSYASSGLQQRIRNNQPASRVPRPRYRHRFGKFVEVFGREAVEIVPFDRARLQGGSVVTDFLQRCGIDPASLPEQRANETMNASATRLVLDFNRSGPRAVGDRALLTARQALIGALRAADDGPRFTLPPDLAAQACERRDIAWLAGTFGIDFARPDLPAPMQPPQEAARLAEELALRPGDRALRARVAAAAGLDIAADLPDTRVWHALYQHFSQTTRQSTS